MKRTTHTYTDQEIDSVLAACNDGPTGAMHRALILTVLGTGLRCAEATALLPTDLDLNGGRLVVQHGKGDKRRVLGLTPRVEAVLRSWMALRLGLLGPAPKAPVFTTSGDRLSGSAVRQLFQRLNRRAGLTKRFHPHGLRHTFADKMARRPEVPIRHIQQMLGHASLATTDIYLRHLCPEDVVQAMRNA